MSTYDNIIAEGIEQGQQEKTISIILSGISNGFTIQDMSVLTNKSIEEVKEIIKNYSE